MDGNYIISDNSGFMTEDELYHWGIKGMKWGVRRYQNADGSLTAAGRKRYTNSDGSLNEKGKKYYAKEKERLAAERRALKARQKTDAQLAKLNDQRKANEELRKSMDPKQKELERKAAEEVKLGRDVLNPYLDVEVANLSTNDLTAINNRINQVTNFRTNMERMGYTFVDKNTLPKSEIDYKIEELKKQKELLGLEKDIRDLKPKKVNRGAQIMETLMNKVVIPTAAEYGKKAVEKYFGEAAAKAADELAKKAGKEAEKQKNKAEKVAEKVAEKQKNKAEKQAEKQATNENGKNGNKTENTSGGYSSIVNDRASANARSDKSFYDRVKNQQKSYDFSSNAKTGTVEEKGTSSSRYAKDDSYKSYSNDDVIDLNSRSSDGSYYYNNSTAMSRPVSSYSSSYTSTGSSYVNRYLNSPISGYLPAPKDRDD